MAALVFVNPFRTGFRDDDWANARTTEHLFVTGEYRLDQWLAPNMAAQAVWGAGFMRVFGAQHSSLYLSSVILFALSLLSMAALAREHGLRPTTAALLALSLLSVQPVLVGGFSYMTDTPALTLQILALWALTRGLRLNSIGTVLIGGLLAALAILVRPQNIALIGGLGLLFIVERKRWRLYGAGLLPPLLAFAATLFSTQTMPTWSQLYVVADTRAYLAQPARWLPLSVGRIGVAFVQLALMVLPLSLISVFAVRKRRVLGVCTPVVVICCIIYALTTGQPIWMPYLKSPFRFEALGGVIFSILLSLGGGALLLLMLERARARLPVHLRLLDANALVAFVAIFASSWWYDRYFIPLLPLVLIMWGHTFEDFEPRTQYRLFLPIAAFCGMLLFFYAYVERVSFFIMETRWNDACYWTYNGYVGGFDRFAAVHDPTLGFDPYDIEIVQTCSP